ncbi:MAG: dihydrofolate reductase [Clostridia bacterium]|nr:dihydrofolate reductase [Clostridia bacterium]
MNLIAAADQNWGIGYQGQLLCHVPADLRRFKELTCGKTVVMGRATLESLPGGRPLPQRRNIVLSSSLEPCGAAQGCQVAVDLPRLFEALSRYDSEDIFIIGGAQLYRDLLPYCRRAYITRLLAAYPADRHLPDLDQLSGWRLTSQSPLQRHGEISYRYCQYENAAPLALPKQPWLPQT